jgi:hypothetical protein
MNNLFEQLEELLEEEDNSAYDLEYQVISFKILFLSLITYYRVVY